MLLVTDKRIINFDNIAEIIMQKSFKSEGEYILVAYTNTDTGAFFLNEYKNKEQAQMELNKFIDSYKENKKIHRFEGD